MATLIKVVFISNILSLLIHSSSVSLLWSAFVFQTCFFLPHFALFSLLFFVFISTSTLFVRLYCSVKHWVESVVNSDEGRSTLRRSNHPRHFYPVQHCLYTIYLCIFVLFCLIFLSLLCDRLSSLYCVSFHFITSAPFILQHEKHLKFLYRPLGQFSVAHWYIVSVWFMLLWFYVCVSEYFIPFWQLNEASSKCKWFSLPVSWLWNMHRVGTNGVF